MGESSEHRQARQMELQNAQLQQQIEQQNLARQNAIYGQISPLASSLLAMSQAGLKGQAPDYFQLGTRNALASSFGQSRQNLADFLGQSGQGFGGLAAGPTANLGAQESSAMGSAANDAILQAIGMGFQGGNMLQGQQAIFNPQAYGGYAGQGFNNYTQATPMQGFGSMLGQSLLGAGINAGSTFLSGGLSNLTKGTGFLGCWVAGELYGLISAERFHIRNWLGATWYMRPFCYLYSAIGRQWADIIKGHRILRAATKSLFDRFLPADRKLSDVARIESRALHYYFRAMEQAWDKH